MGLEGLASSLAGFAEEASPLVDWVKDNWILLVLTGEIVGAVVAVKFGRYRRGLLWLAAALATLWLGIARSRTGPSRTPAEGRTGRRTCSDTDFGEMPVKAVLDAFYEIQASRRAYGFEDKDETARSVQSTARFHALLFILDSAYVHSERYSKHFSKCGMWRFRNVRNCLR